MHLPNGKFLIINCIKQLMCIDLYQFYRLDKLEERECEMLSVQQQVVVKLEEANDIEKQKLELFRTMFIG